MFGGWLGGLTAECCAERAGPAGAKGSSASAAQAGPGSGTLPGARRWGQRTQDWRQQQHGSG